ncbi:uncharacterized protein LOC117650555 [Thrips palmi]|uniref:Uncharacterized protein LOC117650555 n=1 Tax=Thrips palmi TaxID=161013 RepID=A0A6P8ZXZ2_THRPL|nr:uncharacterized protein LOC117650555 [Thrips palmi]
MHGMSSSWCHYGHRRHFLYTLAKHLNFTPEVALPSDGQMYGNPVDFPVFGGLLGDVYSNRSDLSLVFTASDLKLPYHSRPPTAQTTCTTWCLPTGYRQSSVWRPVVGEFTVHTWAAVLLSYLAAALSYRVLCKTDCLAESMLAALQGLVSSLHTVPSDWASRPFVFSWSFSGLVLATLYMAALHGINSSETRDTFFRTLTEVADSKLPMYASSDHLRNFRKAQFDTAGEQAIMERVITFDYNKALPMFHKFFTKPDFGILNDRNACHGFAKLFTPPRKAPRFHVVRNYCLSVSMTNNLILRQNSPLLRPLSVATSRLDEAGLTKYWFDIKTFAMERSPDPVMRMRQLRPFLRVLGIGLAAAIVTFLLEVLVAGVLKCWDRGCTVRREGQATEGVVDETVEK